MSLIKRWITDIVIKRIAKEADKKMNELLAKLSGKKTYAVSIAVVIYAVAGAVAGLHDWKHAIELIMGASGLGALRAGVSKVTK